nr:hypothetical protein [Actinomycetota bacterium]
GPEGAPPPDPEGQRRRKVIVKVHRPGYVPSGFVVRARIDDRMFTAEAGEADLAAAAEDPDIEAVEHPRRLHPDERP